MSALLSLRTYPYTRHCSPRVPRGLFCECTLSKNQKDTQSELSPRPLIPIPANCLNSGDINSIRADDSTVTEPYEATTRAKSRACKHQGAAWTRSRSDQTMKRLLEQIMITEQSADALVPMRMGSIYTKARDCVLHPFDILHPFDCDHTLEARCEIISPFEQFSMVNIHESKRTHQALILVVQPSIMGCSSLNVYH